MVCPRCKGSNIIKHGKFNIKRSKRPIQRFECKDCRHNFVIRGVSYRRKIPLKMRKDILKLRKTRKPSNKYDSTKRKTYSTRDISNITGVGKTTVWKIIRKDMGKYGNGL